MLKALCSLVKSFKNKEGKNKNGIGELTSLEQLSKGDMLRLSDSFALPEGLRSEIFQVQKVATYFYSDMASPQWVIKSSDRTPLYLSINDADGEELVSISRKLNNKDIESLFGWDQLCQAMKDDNNQQITTTEKTASDSNGWMTNWAAASYSRKVFGATGHYVESDMRHSHGVPAGGESFKYFEYYTPDEGKSLEIEVWEGDEIEVCLGLVRPMTDIVELWKKT